VDGPGAEDYARELSDKEKLELLPALTELNRLFVRAWQLGMLVAQSSGDQKCLDEIGSRMHLPDTPPLESDLIPISEDGKVCLAGAMIVRFNMFREAFRRGMLAAQDDEQREILDKLASVLADA
jgi:hypothetical protein